MSFDIQMGMHWPTFATNVQIVPEWDIGVIYTVHGTTQN